MLIHTGDIRIRYKTVQLPETMVKEIQKLIAEHMELGYVSVKGFVEDAVRRRLEAIKGIATPTHDLERRKPMGTAKR